MIILVAVLNHVDTIEQLMKKSGSVATDGPAPEDPMEVLIKPDDLPPPPPVVNPEFVQQIEKPKPKPIVVPPPVVPPPKPVVVAREKPIYTAPKATGSGQTNTVTRLVVGAGGFPAPGYPWEARMHHQTGTVVISIQFDSDGSVSEAEVVESSGVSSLDSNTEQWVRNHWHNASFAGRSVRVPINYHLRG
jgi:TonB family protein